MSTPTSSHYQNSPIQYGRLTQADKQAIQRKMVEKTLLQQQPEALRKGLNYAHEERYMLPGRATLAPAVAPSPGDKVGQKTQPVPTRRKSPATSIANVSVSATFTPSIRVGRSDERQPGSQSVSSSSKHRGASRGRKGNSESA